ncbi:MAG TPA: tRNA preQ1(34) S-adenosylmethionine ribosyltransferase-isomerase QueA [Firmicutes bacterium]|nr:tRNA preQ1(34) S-adenosylmethionine ribosyltransferase-isomerase QueA [Candidatus Fermentithermobacillaceae bacterium]
MRVDEFDYELPPELVAQEPLERRDESRLLVLNRATGEVRHRVFRDVLDYLTSRDALVVNETRVIPARLFGRRSSGGKTEVLLLKDLEGDRWECLVRPGRKVRTGDRIVVEKNGRRMEGEVLARTSYGGRIIKWSYQGNFQENLEALGTVPLPPYVKRPIQDPERYQTVYARIPGSAAAPTAGLHFTPELLSQIESKGVHVVKIRLDVGLGTFRPVRETEVEKHAMHEEYFQISEEAARTINRVRESGGKVVAVGTTVVRALETAASPDGKVRPKAEETRLYIYPGYEFKVVDRLITNFHLPRSTLLMLVCAFAGKELVLKAYREAVKERYRFYSFGDAMLIL